MDPQNTPAKKLGDLSRWPEEDRDWARRFIFALSLKTKVPLPALEKIIDSALETSLASDLPAQKLFGDPDKAAALAVRQETSAEDYSTSRITPLSEALAAALLLMGFLIFVLTWFITDYSSWQIHQSYNLLFVLLVGLIFSLGGLSTWSFISRGRLLSAGSTALLSIGAFAAVMLLSQKTFDASSQPAVPMYAGLLVGVVLGGAGIMTAIAGGYYSAKNDEKEDTRDWFTQLEGFLRGQQAMSKKEAGAVVAEARSHLAELAGDGAPVEPQTEFGSARAYAQNYAGSSIKLIKRKAGLKIAFALLQTLCVIYFSFSLLYKNSFGWLSWPVGILALFIFILQSRTSYREIKKEEKRLIKEAHHG